MLSNRATATQFTQTGHSTQNPVKVRRRFGRCLFAYTEGDCPRGDQAGTEYLLRQLLLSLNHQMRLCMRRARPRLSSSNCNQIVAG